MMTSENRVVFLIRLQRSAHPVSQYPPAAMIALLSRSTNQSRSPKKRKLPSSSPAPQSIPEPFDHGQQAPEFQRVRILQGSEKESRSQDAHPAATTKSHQITARSSGTLEWPCPPIFQVVVRTPKPRETERFLLGARWLLGSGGAGNNFYGAQAQRPRPILLASLIESAPNCAAANGIPSCRFTRSLFPLLFPSPAK